MGLVLFNGHAPRFFSASSSPPRLADKHPPAEKLARRATADMAYTRTVLLSLALQQVRDSVVLRSARDRTLSFCVARDTARFAPTHLLLAAL